MLLSGFTFIRNAIKYDFPITEAVRSMLPIVDELIINVGQSDDGTEKFIENLAKESTKIKIIYSVWDDSKTKDGLVLSEQTNIALSHCTGAWCLYLQADEAVHEKDHRLIREAVEQEDKSKNPVDGFKFNYLHFYGGYSLIQRAWNWYPTEIRIIRRSSGAQSFRDAQTFKIKNSIELKTKLLAAHIHHYGHARDPLEMKKKIQYFHRFWHGDSHGISVEQAYQINLKNLTWFWSTHPNAYFDRIKLNTSKQLPSQFVQKRPENIILFTSKENRSLADEVVSLLRAQGFDGSKIKIISSFSEWFKFIPKNFSKRKNNLLIDLSVEQRSAAAFVLYCLDYFLAFSFRVAHAPNGILSPFRARFFHAISWGRHEVVRTKKINEGFIVPKNQYARALCRCIGIDC